MKKILKYLGITILGVVVVLLVVGLFISSKVKYEQSIVVDSSINEVWPHVSSLHSLDKWSPLNDYEPNMKKNYEGKDGNIGSKVSWDSPVEEVGKGSQTITKIEMPNYFETDLKFYTPYESEAVSYIQLEENGDKTKITWGFKSEMPYPVNVSKLFINMEDMVSEDFENGLDKLKELCN